jgi:hypothetical protein
MIIIFITGPDYQIELIICCKYSVIKFCLELSSPGQDQNRSLFWNVVICFLSIQVLHGSEDTIIFDVVIVL